MFNGDRRFARKHSDEAAKQFYGSVVEEGPSGLVGNRRSRRKGRVFHCDGLLLCTSADESRFVVWNPFTGETRWFLPSYRVTKDRHFALGYYKEGNNKRYKVLSFYHHERFEMYEFGSDSWRVVDDIMDPGWLLDTVLERTSKTEIWVTNKIETTQVVSWSKVLAFYMSPGLQLFDEARFLLDDEKKVVMIALNWYDFEDETKRREAIYIVGEDNEATQVGSWTSDKG
ncbi:unnamed protein product [Microthlaspi erraticum]|uniref:F-box associated beta-propeller type 1 domain-containing protein n=1 Tax=Microthlaspi erraticum TaxID=1685480 RepID=A0A6D2JWE8_9BRAS|nr:unnamed protein product [Microthlaspi erraticum]